jgi:hypothetical protein
VPFSPRPSPLARPPRTQGDLEKHRNFFCSHYDGCLDVSIDAGWESWTCTRCPLQTQASGESQLRSYAEARHKDPVPL